MNEGLPLFFFDGEGSSFLGLSFFLLDPTFSGAKERQCTSADGPLASFRIRIALTLSPFANTQSKTIMPILCSLGNSPLRHVRLVTQ